MKPSIALLGTGGPRPEVSRGGTSLLIEYGDDKILIDAGRGAVRQLSRLGVSLANVNPILITHHHYDHIGELHDVILTSWLLGRRAPLNIYGPPETRRIVQALTTQIYDKDIEFRVEGEPANGAFPPSPVTEIVSGLVCETDRYRIYAERVVHGDGLEFSEAFRSRWVCLGFRFECADGVIAFSGDTVDCPGLKRLAAGADILVQCCYLARSEIVGMHLERLAKHTLACADTVGAIATRAGVRTLVLTHHRAKTAEVLELLRQEVAQDFAGQVMIGHDLLRVSV
jgi:ribonuclease BN (tRNA processing enzyme)